MLRMYPLARLVCVLVSFVFTAQETNAPRPLALTHVTIVDVRDGALRRGQTVVIRGERIAAVGPSGQTAVPDAARVVDSRGRYLTPGLWDMHVHSAASIDWHFPLLVAHGVTGVRNLHATVKAPLELTQSIKARLASGELVGPRFLANGPMVDGEPPAWPGAVVVRRPADGRAAVDRLADAGADFIKVYDNLPREAYFAAADQARRRGLPLLGHIPFAVRPEEAAEAGHHSDEHMQGLESGCSSRAGWVRDERRRVVDRRASTSPIDTVVALFRLERALYDSRELPRCTSTLQAYVRHGTMVVPTLVIHHNNQWPDRVLADSTSMRLVPAGARREWEQRARPGPGDEIPSLMRPTWPQRLENVRLLRDAGVPILAGTDLGNALLVPGVSLHQELALLVEAGLTPLEALQAATLSPARSLDRTDSLGSIEPGKLADLILLDGNPLEDIGNTRHIAAVLLNGRYLDRQALDDLLASVQRAASAQPDSLVDAIVGVVPRAPGWETTASQVPWPSLPAGI